MPRWDGRTPEERFWAKVRKTDGCWIWTAACFKDSGYGAVKRDGVLRRAHRVAWEMKHGPIPDGLDVLHHCDVRPCVRDEHLFLGTQVDNVRDRDAKGRAACGDRNAARLYPEKFVSAHLRKVSHGQAAAIRALRVRGEGTAAIAERFSIGKTTVRRVLHGEHWTDRFSQ